MTTFPSFENFNMTVPNGGPLVVPVTLDFTSSKTVEVDLTIPVQNGVIDYVQTIYVDASNATSTIVCTCDVTNQRVYVQPGDAQYIPVLMPNPPKFTFTVDSTGFSVSAFFTNVPIPPFSMKGLGKSSSSLIYASSYFNAPVTSTSAFATKASQLFSKVDVEISYLAITFSCVAGASYIGHISTIAAGTISTITKSDPITVANNGYQLIIFPLKYLLTKETQIFVGVTRTDAAANYVLPLVSATWNSEASSIPMYNGLPLYTKNISPCGYTSATINPVIGTNVNIFGPNSSPYLVGLIGSANY